MNLENPEDPQPLYYWLCTKCGWDGAADKREAAQALHDKRDCGYAVLIAGRVIGAAEASAQSLPRVTPV